MTPRYHLIRSVTVSAEDLILFKRQGFHWVRRRPQTWVQGLRNPTSGSMLELTRYWNVDSVPIGSREALRLFLRLAV